MLLHFLALPIPRPASFHFAFPEIFWNQCWENEAAVKNFPEVWEIYKRPGFLKTKDGKSIIAGVGSDKEWNQARAVFGERMRGPPEKEEAWRTISSRVRDLSQLMDILTECVASFTLEEFAAVTVEVAEPVVTTTVVLVEITTTTTRTSSRPWLTSTPPSSARSAKTAVRRACSMPSRIRGSQRAWRG